jgi:hypothetical protein
MRFFVAMLIALVATSWAGAGGPDDSGSCRPQIGFFIAIGYARVGTPEDAHIWGATNLPPDSVLSATCYDFIGEGSHAVSKEMTVKVSADGLFSASLTPKESYRFKDNMMCSVSFLPTHQQPMAVTEVTGRKGERLGNVDTNSQIGTNSGGQYLEAETVLHD